MAQQAYFCVFQRGHQQLQSPGKCLSKHLQVCCSKPNSTLPLPAQIATNCKSSIPGGCLLQPGVRLHLALHVRASFASLSHTVTQPTTTEVTERSQGGSYPEKHFSKSHGNPLPEEYGKEYH